MTNCLLYDSSDNLDDTVGKCKVCDKGYNLTSSFYCEKVTVANCSDTDSYIYSIDSTENFTNALTNYIH